MNFNLALIITSIFDHSAETLKNLQKYLYNIHICMHVHLPDYSPGTRHYFLLEHFQTEKIQFI